MCRKLTIERHIGTQGQKAPPRRRHVQSGRAGFTLTEVLVASALLMTALVPILKGLTSVHVHSIRIERKTRSLTLAQAKLDEIKALSTYNYASSFTETNNPLDGSYLCTVTDGAVNANLRMIAVAVGHDTDGNNALGGDEVLVTLETLIAKRW
jgi:Tfp pilus assembly protein PilV